MLRLQGLGFVSALKLFGVTVFLPLMLGVLTFLVWALFSEDALFYINREPVTGAVGLPVIRLLFSLAGAVPTLLSAIVAWTVFAMVPVILKVTRAEALRAGRKPRVAPDVRGARSGKRITYCERRCRFVC